jgi:hypothetical protein
VPVLGTSGILNRTHLVSSNGEHVDFALTGISGDAPSPLFVGALDPWGSWPPASVGAVFSPIDAATLVVGPTTAPGSFAVLGGLPLVLLPAVNDSGQAISPPVKADGGQPFPTPRFVARTATGHLLGRHLSIGVHSQLDLVRSDGVQASDVFPSLGCATAPMVADATTLGDGSTVVVLANGRAFGDCLLDDGFDGPPERVQLARVVGSKVTKIAVEVISPGDVVSSVQIVPRGTDAWVAYRYAGIGAEVPPQAFAMRVSAAGEPVVPPRPIAPESAGVFAIKSFHGGLAVAYTDVSEPGPGTIIVATYDAALQPTGSITVPHPGGLLAQDVALIAAPSDLDLLLGFTQHEASTTRAYLARLTCLPSDLPD